MGFIDLFIQKEETPNEATAQQAASTPIGLSDNTTAPIQQVQPVNPNTTLSTPASSVNMSAVSTTTSAVVTETNEDIIRALFQAVVEQREGTPDYIAVKQNAEALASMGLPEQQRIEAAFKMLSATNKDFTKDKLLASIDKYVEIIRNEIATGHTECEEKRKEVIGEKEKEKEIITNNISDVKSQIETMKQQIVLMEQQIQEKMNVVANLEKEIAESTASISKEEQIFTNSANFVITKLLSDKQTISSLNI